MMHEMRGFYTWKKKLRGSERNNYNIRVCAKNEKFREDIKQKRGVKSYDPDRVCG